MMAAARPLASNALTIKEALGNFIEANELDADGGQHANWVKLRFGRFYIPFPNSKGRKEAVKYHDIHHLLTGYPTTWKGEAMLGAWEVASGCGKYRAAWIFDMGIFAISLFIFPLSIYKAFKRGRSSANFFNGRYAYNQILQMDIDEARQKINLDNHQLEGSSQALSFMVWWLFSFIISFLVFIAPGVYLVHLIVD